jgi:hypothetical protein
VARTLIPRRAGRRTNLGLLALLALAGGSGVLAFGVGTPGPSRVVVAVHGAAGLGLLLLVPWKAVIVRRARARAPAVRAPGPAVALAGAAGATVLTGVLHSVGLRGPAALPMLTLHVGFAVVSAALLVLHAWGRRQRLHRTDLSRRTLLRSGGIAAGAAALWFAGEGLLRVAGAPGADRRGTGSHERGTDDPAAMPVTQWFTDTVPGSTDDALEVVAGGKRLRVAIGDLDRGDAVRAALDCTGGWFAVQDWRGVRLDRLLPGAGELPRDGSIDVVSHTGYRRRLPLRDAGSLLLATHCAGRPLSRGHGAPVRLVAPGRRGFWWVKWVVRVEVVDAPWWLQPPFPLQ